VYGLLLHPDVDDPLDSTLALAAYDDNGAYEASIIAHTAKYAGKFTRSELRAQLTSESLSLTEILEECETKIQQGETAVLKFQAEESSKMDTDAGSGGGGGGGGGGGETGDGGSQVDEEALSAPSASTREALAVLASARSRFFSSSSLGTASNPLVLDDDASSTSSEKALLENLIMRGTMALARILFATQQFQLCEQKIEPLPRDAQLFGSFPAQERASFYLLRAEALVKLALFEEAKAECLDRLSTKHSDLKKVEDAQIKKKMNELYESLTKQVKESLKAKKKMMKALMEKEW